MFWILISPVQDLLRGLTDGVVTKNTPEEELAKGGGLCEMEPLSVDVVPYGFVEVILPRVFPCRAVLFFHLHPKACTAPRFTQSIGHPPPEAFIFLLRDNCQDLASCLLVFPLSSCIQLGI